MIEPISISLAIGFVAGFGGANAIVPAYRNGSIDIIQSCMNKIAQLFRNAGQYNEILPRN